MKKSDIKYFFLPISLKITKNKFTMNKKFIVVFILVEKEKPAMSGRIQKLSNLL